MKEKSIALRGIFTSSFLAVLLVISVLLLISQAAFAAIVWPSTPTGQVAGGKITNVLHTDVVNARIGIGTNTPAARFHLVGSGSSVILTDKSSDGDGDDCPVGNEKIPLDAHNIEVGYKIGDQTVTAVDDEFVCTDDSGIAWKNGDEKWWINPDSQIVFDKDGHIAIGATTVKNGLSLDVQGKIGASEWCDTNGANCVAQATLSGLSDERLKENIIPVSGLAAIEQLNGVKFNWKATGKADIGVLAQNVETVFPELVTTADDEAQTKSVHYDGLIAPLIEAVKELKAENDELLERVVELEALVKTDIENQSARADNSIQYGGFCPAVS